MSITNTRNDVQVSTSTGTAESELWRAWNDRQDPVAREKLMLKHLPYARIVAATYYKRRTHDEVEFDEYLQLASLGMLESLDRYDPALGAQFTTFAARRMHGAILNGLVRLTEKNQQIAVRSGIRRERLLAIKADAMSAIDHSAPVDPAIDSVNRQALFSFLAEVGVGLALGVMLEGTGMIDSDLLDGDTQVISPEVSYFRKSGMQQLQATLRDVLRGLGDQEQTVIREHYLHEVSFDSIATSLGVKRSRVSQIHRQALRNLRACLGKQTFDLIA